MKKRQSIASLTTLAAALVTTSAFAQSEASDRPAASTTNATQGLNEIIVTARKTAENLQDVPVSVTAFSGETLTRLGAVSLGDIGSVTPGLAVREAPSNPSAFIIALRGQVQVDILATLEPSVGVYLDEMYVARAFGLNADLVDVKSVQVLKGPQGTLFGRNTTGGAVLLATNDAELGEFSGRAEIGYGRFDDRRLTGVLNVPIGDRGAVRGAIRISKRDGYMTDINTGAKYGGRDILQGRLKARYEVTENLSVDLSGEWYDAELDGPIRKNIFAGSTFFTPVATAAGAADAATQALAIRTKFDQVAVSPTLPNAANPFMPSIKAPAYTDVSSETYIGKIALDTDFGEITLINGYRRVKSNGQIDLDGTAFSRHTTQGYQDLKQYSTELQITGEAAGSRLNYVAGLTYFKETGIDFSSSARISDVTPAAINWTIYSGEIDNDSMGIYGQASFNLTDRVTLSGGLRYSVDDKAVSTQSAVFRDNDTLTSCQPSSFPVAVSQCVRSRKASFSALSYMLGADYEVSQDIMVYAKTSRGYRSGAMQLRTLTLTDTDPAQPEIVREHEIGFKSELLDRRVRFNVAAYYNKIKGAQRQVTASLQGVSQTLLENANVRNYGVEAEIEALVVRGLSLAASGSYNNGKYTSYTGIVGNNPNFDKSDTPIDGIPKLQYLLAADYSTDLGTAGLSANVSWNWTDKVPSTSENAATLAASGTAAANIPFILKNLSAPAWGSLNARVAVQFGNDRNMELAAWGRNILDKRVYTHLRYLGGPNDYLTGLTNEPATYGVTASYRF